ncbi:MAG TPA: methionine synthase [Dermatophilaceae bacterium]|nr:methionine synthase [Dermatophilaceae bacterium]
MTRASGIGSWPGVDIREAATVVRDLLVGLDVDGVTGLPYLPELPGRGPGGDLVGRTAGLLVDLPVDLQPGGWRLVDRPGRDLARTHAFWREDLDVLAEVYDGYLGPLKIAVAGPWTLAASLWLHRGERVVVDDGAVRDLGESLAEGVRHLLRQVRRLVPGAELVVQYDEPSLPAVLSGEIPTASGLGRLAPVDPQSAIGVLRTVVAAAGDRPSIVHCCAAYPPLPVLRAIGAAGLALDTTLLTPRGWEGVAVALDDGMSLYAGCLPTSAEITEREAARDVTAVWDRIGLSRRDLAAVTVTPTCGLAASTPAEAIARQRAVVDIARRLAARAQD